MGEKLPMILSPLLEQDGPSSIGLLQGSERTSGTQYNIIAQIIEQHYVV